MDQTAEQKAEQKSYGYGKRPMWQWVVLYLVIGGIIYAGAYYFFLAKKGGYNYNQSGQYQTQPSVQQPSPTTAQTSPSPAMQSQNTVTLTASGFSPAVLTIQAGDTVTWLNKSGKTATVNSDPHPTHTAYRPLNLDTFQDGDSLTLTFGRAGTYGYHNHLNASERGTIIVK